MNPSGRKSSKRAANDLTVLLRTLFGEERFPVDVEALARDVSGNNEDLIVAILNSGRNRKATSIGRALVALSQNLVRQYPVRLPVRCVHGSPTVCESSLAIP